MNCLHLRRYAILFGALTVSSLLSGCDPVSSPDPAQPAGSAAETPYSFKYHPQITWNVEQLNLLKSLQIQYPGRVSIRPSSDQDELSVQIEFEVEKSHDADYSNEYLKQVMAQSNLQAQDEKLLIPAPSHPCKETFDSSGNLVGLEGICVREMTLLVPAPGSVQIAPLSIEATSGVDVSNVFIPSLDLVLGNSSDDSTRSEINQLTGNLKVRGGGPNALLSVNGLLDAGQKTSGSLDVELSSLKQIELTNIAGKVHVGVAQPPTDPNAVSLDGKSITSFPFDRP